MSYEEETSAVIDSVYAAMPMSIAPFELIVISILLITIIIVILFAKEFFFSHPPSI